MEKRYNVANCILIGSLLIISTLEWHFAEWYGMFTPYGTLIMFVSLSAALLLYNDVVGLMKDPVFWLICGTVIFAFINLLILDSNKGCILVVANMSIVLYLSNKLKFTKGQMHFILSYLALFFFYWTVDVKGYFKGYNTNYGALILITGFACLMVLSEIFTDYLRKKNDKRGYLYVALEMFFIALAFNIISWYRSRAALVGLIVLLFIKFIPLKIMNNKVVYYILSLFGTLGGIAVSLIYIAFGNLKESVNLTLFYKDLISGREVLWSELWNAFIQRPITGIGSSYVVKTEWMDGMLEVHNGMLDIMIVHGVIVFIPIFLLFTKRLFDNRVVASESRINKACFGALICMMATSFFENFIIVQPFTLVILFLLAFQNGTVEKRIQKNIN